MRSARWHVLVGPALLWAAACGTSVFDVVEGQCVDVPDEDTVSDVTAVDCDEPHEAEVYAVATLEQAADVTYPGDDAVLAAGEQRCVEHFEPYVGIAYAESAFFSSVLVPSADSWVDGDREVVCLLVGADQDQLLTGSQRDSRE